MPANPADQSNKPVRPTAEEQAVMFGGPPNDPAIAPAKAAVQAALSSIRKQLMQAIQAQGTFDGDAAVITRLAQKLHQSPEAVHAFLNRETDISISTMVLYAQALGLQWHINLVLAHTIGITISDQRHPSAPPQL